MQFEVRIPNKENPQMMQTAVVEARDSLSALREGLEKLSDSLDMSSMLCDFSDPSCLKITDPKTGRRIEVSDHDPSAVHSPEEMDAAPAMSEDTSPLMASLPGTTELPAIEDQPETRDLPSMLQPVAEEMTQEVDNCEDEHEDDNMPTMLAMDAATPAHTMNEMEAPELESPSADVAPVENNLNNTELYIPTGAIEEALAKARAEMESAKAQEERQETAPVLGAGGTDMLGTPAVTEEATQEAAPIANDAHTSGLTEMFGAISNDMLAPVMHTMPDTAPPQIENVANVRPSTLAPFFEDSNEATVFEKNLFQSSNVETMAVPDSQLEMDISSAPTMMLDSFIEPPEGYFDEDPEPEPAPEVEAASVYVPTPTPIPAPTPAPVAAAPITPAPMSLQQPTPASISMGMGPAASMSSSPVGSNTLSINALTGSKGQYSPGMTTETLANVFMRAMDIYDHPEISDAMNFVLELGMMDVNAGGGAVLLTDINSPDPVLWFESAIGAKANDLLNLTAPFGQGIIGYAAQKGVTQIVADVEHEPRFKEDILSNVGLAIGSMLCVPIQHEKRVYGAIVFYNAVGERPYTQGEASILGYLAHCAGEYLAAQSH